MKKTLAVLAILAGAVLGAQAGLALFDSFSYGDGSIVTNSGGSWFDNSGSTTSDDCVISNGFLRVSSLGARDVAHFLDQTYYTNNGTMLYATFTLKLTALPTAAGTYFTAFAGTNGYYNPANHQFMAGYRGRVIPCTTRSVDATPAPTGQFWLGISPAGTATTNGLWATPLDTNVTYTIYTKYNVDTGASTLWVNPANESDVSVTDSTPLVIEPTTAAPTNGVLNVAGYCFRQASGEGTVWIGALKVGTSWAYLTTAPLIAPAPAAQFIPENGSTPALGFQVSSPVKTANQLTLTNLTPSTALVPNDGSHVVFTRDSGGTNCTVKVTPATGQQGVQTVTVGVTDGTDTSTMSFLLSVGTPHISAIANVTAVTNTPVPTTSFTTSDAESDPLTFSVFSSNTGLLASDTAHITISGTAPNYTVTLTPVAGQIGSSKVTIYVTDTHTTNSSSFYLTMRPLVGVVYTENFAYTDFDLPQALYLATGGSGAPWYHVSGPTEKLQVTNVTGTSGFAYIVGTNNEDVGAAFIGGATYDGTNGYVFYTSFTVNFSYLPSNLGDYFFHLSSSGTDTSNFRDKVFAQQLNAAAGMFRLGIANMATTPVQLPRDLASNQTYAVVTRYNAGTGESALWVNPTSEQSPAAIATDSAGTSSTIGGVGLRQPGCCTGDLAVGPIKVGTSFSDVFSPTVHSRGDREDIPARTATQK